MHVLLTYRPATGSIWEIGIGGYRNNAVLGLHTSDEGCHHLLTKQMASGAILDGQRLVPKLR